MYDIPGYLLNNLLEENSVFQLYSAYSNLHKKNLQIKFYHFPTASQTEMEKLTNDYEDLKNSPIPGLQTILEVLSLKNRVAVVLEDYPYESLKSYMKDKSGNIKLILSLAIKISNTLLLLHKTNKFHGSITYDNVLIKPDTGHIEITNARVNELLIKELKFITLDDYKLSSLRYISPEQTFKGNRKVDHRTDFYSLGLVLYYLLLEEYPFPLDNSTDILYSHMALPPKHPQDIKTQLPTPISDILLKLLAKNVEDRYQSAFGLKYDLEQCFHQMEQTGSIKSFPVGTKDRQEQLNLSERLYGREKELRKLHDYYERIHQGDSQILFVSGSPGIGKTFLVEDFFSRNFANPGYFLTGKYDQSRRDIPYDGLAQALSLLIKQILTESDEILQYWKERIQSKLGENCSILIQFIPELEYLIGVQPPVKSIGLEESKNRFQLALTDFIQLFCSLENPMILFLDNLHWVDSASLSMLQTLIENPTIQYLFIIASYRNTEVNADHPLQQWMDELEKNQIHSEIILLNTLTIPQIETYIKDNLLHSRESLYQLLARFINEKTGGNPLFIKQYLVSLYENGLIWHDDQLGWMCNNEKLQMEGLTEHILVLLSNRLYRLPPKTLELIKICACIGNRINLDHLAVISLLSIKEILLLMTNAVQNGIITIREDECYFIHDKVQEAAYSLLTDPEKEEIHYQIAKALVSITNKNTINDHIYVIVHHFHKSRSLIKTEREKYEVIQLNLVAASKAKDEVAYETSLQYCNSALDLLPVHAWEDNYKLSLSLYHQAAESAFLYTKYDQMVLYNQQILQYGKSFLDKMKAYEITLLYYIANNDLPSAIKHALNALSMMGIRFPEKAKQHHVIKEMVKIKIKMSGKTIKDLEDLPVMKDPLKLAILRMLILTSVPAFLGDANLYPLIIIKLLELTLKHGNSKYSPFIYSTYGILLQIAFNQTRKAIQLSEFALKLMEQYDSKEFKAKVHLLYYSFVYHWNASIKDTLEPLKEGYRVGLETGDVGFAAHCMEIQTRHLIHSGIPLNEIEKTNSKYSDIIKRLKQERSYYNIQLHFQFIHNLMGKAKDPLKLTGQCFNEEKMVPFVIKIGDEASVFPLYLYKMMLCYIFNQYEQALDNGEKTIRYIESIASLSHGAWCYFFYGLTLLKLYNTVSKKKKRKYYREIKSIINKMENWATKSKDNFEHMLLLLQAELSRINHQNYQAELYYEKAIKSARENGFLMEECLANECAFAYHRENNKDYLTLLYLQEAIYYYKKWGALLKVKELEKLYSELSLVIDAPVMLQPTLSNEPSIKDNRELMSVIKASQVISQEIILEKLLETVMHTILENARADRGFILLEKSDRLEIAVNGRVELNCIECSLQTKTTSLNDKFSFKIVNYVKRTRETVLIGANHNKQLFSNDPYLQKANPKSILCLPIEKQKKLIGILYLENTLSAHAFTEDQVLILNILAPQAAISLENAQLYQEIKEAQKELNTVNELLEKKVKQRTLELQKAFEKTEQADRHKTIFLTDMSHEIRTPLNSIIGYIELMLIDKDCPEKFKKHLERVKDSGMFLSSLINNILDLAKIESGQVKLEPKPCSVSELFEKIHSQSLALLSTMKKDLELKKSISSDIQDTILCDVLRLQQILTNLLQNAIKFTTEGFIEYGVFLNHDNQLEFYVKDTGKGIPDNKLEEIFNPFKQLQETHKSSYEGTGIGLTISQKLAELMGDGLKVQSEQDFGSTFYFTLPYQPVNKKTALTKGPLISQNKENKDGLILLVEDNEENKIVTKGILESLGYQVILAEDGIQAVETYQKHSNIHLILMDIRMPKMDGLEATRAIRALEQQENKNRIPIVALTAAAMKNDIQKGYEAGCDSYLTKPLDIQKLIENLRKYIPS